MLDGAALLMTVCDVPRQSRAELCVEAGVGALGAIADFLGVAHRPPEGDAEITLPTDLFDDAQRRLEQEGVPGARRPRGGVARVSPDPRPL